MPLYEYVCSSCSHAFEELVQAKREQRVECPVCHSTRVDKQFSTIARPRVAKTASHACAGPGCCSGGACPYES